MQRKDYHYWLEHLRVTATISVILLHVAGRVLVRANKPLDFDWWVANIFDSAVRFSVPVFVMLSGALLLPKEEPISIFLKKRFGRIVLPFVFWSAVYIGAYYGSLWSKGTMLSFPQTMTWLATIISGGIAIHLWYVFMIAGLYLFIPILGKWARQASDRELLYFLSLWIFTLCIGLLPQGSSFIRATHLTYFTSYIGYLVLGLFLSRSPYERGSLLVVSWLLTLVGTAITAWGTYFLTAKNGSLDETFYGFLTPNVIITSIGIFLFFKLREQRFVKPGRLFGLINQYSYGIFLVHVLMLTLLEKLEPIIPFQNELIVTPLLAIICLGLSLAVVYTVNKLPFGKYISG